jgi:predicted metal-dependent hydrolase
LKERGEDATVRDYFREGVEQFNAEKFFDAHESWEAIWLHAPEPDKTFLQGITQVSAAFHHYSKGNYAGAKTLLERGLQKLAQFPVHYRGVKVDRLREEAGRWLVISPQRKEDRKEPRPKIEWV